MGFPKVTKHVRFLFPFNIKVKYTTWTLFNEENNVFNFSSNALSTRKT